MPNTLGVYNPIFYANEALIQLEKALGMAARVHRGYDDERKSANKGETINIRRPGSFTAQDAPSSAQDLDTETVAMTLNYWKEVKFSLTDKELALSEERIIADHVRPAAYALADDVDQKLAALYKNIPWYDDAQGSASILDLTGPYKTLFDNGVPMMDGMLHLMVNGVQQSYFQQLDIFHDASVRGGGGTTETLLRGSLGNAMGFEVFANQNVQSHTGGTGADAAGAVNGEHSKGATTLAVNSLTTGETFKAGDTFLIAGNTQRYAITADAAVADSAVSLSITPGLAAALDGAEIVTFDRDSHAANMAFHRNAFAFASAPLPDVLPNQLGAQVTTITDPITGLSLRARLFYDGNNSKVYVALDILYAVQTLDPNLATRLRG